MNWTAYPRHWLRLHIIIHRHGAYVSLYLGWGWRYRRWHFSRGAI